MVVLSYPSTAVSTPIKVPQKEQLRKATNLPNFLSESNFPALEAGVSLTKEHRSKLRDAASNGGGAHVFREAYHAQLREVHGANMRAVEAMEEDEEAPTGWRRKRALDSDMVNSLMHDARREIAAEGQLVTKEMVRIKCHFKATFQHFWLFYVRVMNMKLILVATETS